MADRYWVGGDGNWDATTTTNWATTSGGAGGASAPTSADNVIFDANSNVGTDPFTVTVAGNFTTPSLCNDFTVGSLDGAMTLVMGSTSYLGCYGSMTLPAINFTWNGVGGARLGFSATTTGKTITTNGVALILTRLDFNGVGGEWTLGSALTFGLSHSLVFTNGTFNTGNFNITGGALFVSSQVTTKVINLGSSTLTLSAGEAINIADPTGLTFNAGTSTIICTQANATFTGGGLTFNNVTFSAGGGTKTINGANTYNGQFLVSEGASTTVSFTANQIFSGGALFQSPTLTVIGNGFSYTGTVNFASATHGFKIIEANQTFQNLTITCPAVDGSSSLALNGNTTVTGTLTTTDGGTTARRVQIGGLGTPQTLSVGTNSLINTDFGNTVAAGAASWVLGLGYGDLGNNTGITFDSSTLYWIGGSGTWSDTTKWSTASGGSAANAIPLYQNSVIFDANSNVGTGAFTVTVTGVSGSASLCNDFTASSLDGAMTLSLPATAILSCYGSMTLPATNFTWTGTSGAIFVFSATTTGKTITTNGVSLTATQVQFNGVGGEWTLGSAFTNTVNGIVVVAGSLVTSNFNITSPSINASGTSTRSINLGSSTLTLSFTAPINFSIATGLTFTAGTSQITCSNANPTFAGGGLTFYNVTFSSTAISVATITGANTFNNLTYTARAAAGIGAAIFENSVTNTINGTLTLGSGTTGVARLFVRSQNIGTTTTLSVATLTAPTDIDFRDIIASGASSPWSGTRLGNGLGNSNITFGAGVNKYWNLAAGGNWNAAAWALTSSGSPSTANFPLAQDTAIIENTGLNTSATITLNGSYQIGTLDFSSRSNAATFATGTTSPSICGNYVLSSAITVSGTGVLQFTKQNGTATITSAGVNFTQPITCNAANGTLRIDGNLTLNSARTFTLTQGTLDLTNNGAGNFTLSTGAFSSTNSNTRSITFGTGNITVTGNNAIVYDTNVMTNFSYTGTPTVNFTYSGSTGTRTLRQAPTGNGGTESNVVNMNISAGSDIVSIGGSVRVYKNVNFTGFTGSCTVGLIGFFGNLTFSSGMTVGGTDGAFFSATSGTQLITTNGKTLDFNVTQNGVGGTVQLQDNLTIGSTRTFTLTAGTLDLNDKTLSAGLFSSNNSNTRSIIFGTGNITVTGNNATVWSFATATNFSYTGTSTVNFTYSGSTGTRTIANPGAGLGGTEANALNINILAGSDIINFGGSSRIYKNLNFTGFSGTYTNTDINIVGNLTISTGMSLNAGVSAIVFSATSGTQQITTNGKTLDFPLTQNGVGGTVQLQDNLTTGSTRVYRLDAGTLDLSSGNRTLSTGFFSSSNSNTRSITFGTGNITVTGNNAAVFNINTITNFSFTGTSNIIATYSGSVGIRSFFGGAVGGSESVALNLSITAGSDIVAVGNPFFARNLNFTGFSGTLSDLSRFIYGDLTFSSGMTLSSGTGSTAFRASSGTQQVTTNGQTIGFRLVFGGGTNIVEFQDALTQLAGYDFAIDSGTVRLKNGTTNVVGNFTTATSSAKALESTLAGTQATISTASTIPVFASYLNIKDSNAANAGIWNASLSDANQDGGNNTGWNFNTSRFFLLF